MIDKNLLLNQIIKNGENYSIKEISPFFINKDFPLFLSIDSSLNIKWESPHIDIKPFYISEGRIGIDRSPLLLYKFDISTPKNKMSTSFHIGDGEHGFSMGNGTNDGFLPQIIGMGSDEMDPGLYFLGVAGNNVSSDIPLVIIDGRSNSKGPLNNRPIFGITSGVYNDYKLTIGNNGNVSIGKKPGVYKLDVKGEIGAEDIILNEKSLLKIIDDLRKEINILREKIKPPLK